MRRPEHSGPPQRRYLPIGKGALARRGDLARHLLARRRLGLRSGLHRCLLARRQRPLGRRRRPSSAPAATAPGAAVSDSTSPLTVPVVDVLLPAPGAGTSVDGTVVDRVRDRGPGHARPGAEVEVRGRDDHVPLADVEGDDVGGPAQRVGALGVARAEQRRRVVRVRRAGLGGRGVSDAASPCRRPTTSSTRAACPTSPARSRSTGRASASPARGTATVGVTLSAGRFSSALAVSPEEPIATIVPPSRTNAASASQPGLADAARPVEALRHRVRVQTR